ncbi:SDR family oxidoreductase [Thorsellia anophelis]|uniref:Short-chain dehydrogenase n=1 Tax=Thorsellia anophelis DSM 18579 TaxID=1123402 RepID=A0A1I0EYZ2_9GAMM|nr:SDR family oxidoreductase [Thorsellia anophelis]SET50358.1 Short-chain dehydrogenase [Thorsellia anophelis DSM 18579]
MNINNKTILLTGATGGIGKAIAIDLASKGANITLVGRNLTELESMVIELKSRYQNQFMSYLICDLSSSNGVTSLNEFAFELAREGKPIDILINCAGINQFQFFAQRNPSSIRQEMDINLMAPMLICQSAISWLNKPGIMMNIGSTFGAIGYPGYASYCAAKAGLQRFSEALDRELDGSGIRVLYIAPRATQTKINTKSVDALNKSLGNQTDTPEIVAKAVINSIEKEIAIQWLGWPERLFVKINQLFPFIVSHVIHKQQDKIHNFINQNNHDSI